MSLDSAVTEVQDPRGRWAPSGSPSPEPCPEAEGAQRHSVPSQRRAAFGEADILLDYFSAFEDVENGAVSNHEKTQFFQRQEM